MSLLEKLAKDRGMSLAEVLSLPAAADPVDEITEAAPEDTDPATFKLDGLHCDLPARVRELFVDAHKPGTFADYCAFATRALAVIEQYLSPAQINYNRWRCACPAGCEPDLERALDAKPLVYLDVIKGSDSVYLRCTNGCEPAAIASGFRELILEHERREDDDLQAAFDRAYEAQQIAETQRIESEVSIGSLADVADQRWLVPGFLGADMLTILGGTSGDGKTYESLHVAICVAAGLPWFGRRVQPARVLLVLLEGAASDRKARVLKLARGLGTNLAALQGRLDLYPHDLKADNARSLAALNDYIARLGYGLVVIDNLSEIRSTGAHGAENDTAIMTAVLKPLADLAHARQAGILLLHHANARGELRGSSAIRQHADAVFEMDRASPANDAPVTLTRTKDRTGETFESLTYRMVDDDSAGRENRRVIPELVTRNRRGAATEETTEPISVSDLTARQVALRNIVHENPGLGVNAVGRAYTERTGKSPSMRDVTADLAWLVDDGQLRRDDAKKYFPVED